jgi:hypothetical protein
MNPPNPRSLPRSAYVFFFLLALGIVFHQYGRGILHPFLLKISGKRSVEEVLTTIGPKTFKRMQPYFESSGAQFPPQNLTLIACKTERSLEIWGTTSENRNVLIKTYPFTSFSGTIGPKLKEGDRQIPEGTYPLMGLNPNSSYHLSIKIGYPTPYELEMGKREGRTNLGGDVFIHGKNVTIGCIPIGDEAIEELFCLVARTGIENCSIMIMPYDFRKQAPTPHEIPWVEEMYKDMAEELSTFRR